MGTRDVRERPAADLELAVPAEPVQVQGLHLRQRDVDVLAEKPVLLS